MIMGLYKTMLFYSMCFKNYLVNKKLYYWYHNFSTGNSDIYSLKLIHSKIGKFGIVLLM